MFQFLRGLFAPSVTPSTPDLRVRLAVGGMEERATPASLPGGDLFPQAVIHEPMIQSHPTLLDIHAADPSRVAIVSHY